MVEKNVKKLKDKEQRVTFGMNLGTRTHKSAKDYNRKANKVDKRNLED